MLENKTVTAIILCAGSGKRMMAGKNKLLLSIDGNTIVWHTLQNFLKTDFIDSIMLVHSRLDSEYFEKLKAISPKINLCLGGSSRTQSVKNALKSISPCDIVSIHDGARPYVDSEIIHSSALSAIKHGSGIASLPLTDTIAIHTLGGEISSSVDRASCIAIQTPQSFNYEEICEAYRNLKPDDVFTDDSGVYLKYCKKPHLSQGGAHNKKITYQSDIEKQLKIGVGQDTHRFESGRKLILGGAHIPYEKGLLGHSDADVLTHAVMDSLLSAAGLKDIGNQFPDTNGEYKDICSLKLLSKVQEMLQENHTEIVSISSVIVCQAPKLMGYIDDMRQNIADTLKIPTSKISISATTTEHLNAEGEGLGITATATSLVKTY